MASTDKSARLKAVRSKVLGLSGELADLRQQEGYFPVIGEGNHDANIMFIGEAPGENEAKTGRPFCGRSGSLLDEFLEYVDLDRESVYITNVLKDRPPENRDPTPGEIARYTPFLQQQIDIIEPCVIATLGRFAMEFIADKYNGALDGTITQIRGQIFAISAGNRKITFVPLLHPAVALYDGSKRDVLKEDFKILQQYAN